MIFPLLAALVACLVTRAAHDLLIRGEKPHLAYLAAGLGGVLVVLALQRIG